jgi:hypothetical protein
MIRLSVKMEGVWDMVFRVPPFSSFPVSVLMVACWWVSSWPERWTLKEKGPLRERGERLALSTSRCVVWSSRWVERVVVVPGTERVMVVSGALM